MKKLLTIIGIALTLISTAQVQPYQKDKKFYPFITGGAGFGGKELWSSFDVGAMNKNSMIAFGVSSHLWDENYLILYASYARRFVTVGRFEGWAALTTMTAWKEQLPFKLQTQIKIAYNADKAFKLFVQANTIFTAPHYKYEDESNGIGVTIPIRGKPFDK